MRRRGSKSPRFDASDPLLDAPIAAQLDLKPQCPDLPLMFLQPPWRVV
jgi:hypothetical protein